MNNIIGNKSNPLVISYLRFSRPEQIHGDSQRRQLEMSKQWAEARGLTITDNLSDLGISAFRGANAEKGSLAAFLKLVREDRIPPGSILLIENLDRLSRTELLDAQQQFISIIQSGVKIVTLKDGYEYDKANANLPNMMYSLMQMSLAHEESSKKSFRLAESWKSKRKKAADKPLTGMVPSWLKLDANKIVINQDKAVTIRLIFRLAAQGHGLLAITQKLNQQGIGLGKRNIDKIGRSYVAKILHNRQVLGEFQPHTATYTKGKKTRVPIGDPLLDYYPRVITDDEFYAAQGAMRTRLSTGGPSSKSVNLFMGLLYSNDGSRLQIQDKGFGKRYVSAAAIEGRRGAAEKIGFPVKPFEHALLMRLADPSIYESGSGDVEQVRLEIDAAEGRIAEIASQIIEVQESLLNGIAQAGSVIALLSRLDSKRDELQDGLGALRAKACSFDGGDARRKLLKLMLNFNSSALGNEERTTLQNGLRKIVERIQCHFIREGRDYICGAVIRLRSGIDIDYSFRAHHIDRMKRNELGHPIKGGAKGDPLYELTIWVGSDKISQPDE